MLTYGTNHLADTYRKPLLPPLPQFHIKYQALKILIHECENGDQGQSENNGHPMHIFKYGGHECQLWNKWNLPNAVHGNARFSYMLIFNYLYTTLVFLINEGFVES